MMRKLINFYAVAVLFTSLMWMPAADAADTTGSNLFFDAINIVDGDTVNFFRSTDLKDCGPCIKDERCQEECLADFFSVGFACEDHSKLTLRMGSFEKGNEGLAGAGPRYFKPKNWRFAHQIHNYWRQLDRR